VYQEDASEVEAIMVGEALVAVYIWKLVKIKNIMSAKKFSEEDKKRISKAVQDLEGATFGSNISLYYFRASILYDITVRLLSSSLYQWHF